MKRGIHFIHLYADSASEWNCSQWRNLTPADAMNAEHEAGRTPNTAQLFHLPSALDWNHPQVQDKLGRGDVLIFQRNVITKDVYDVLDYWRALGKLCVIDLDDGYPYLPPSNPAYLYWIRNHYGLEPEPIAALEEGLRHADFLTSPSKVILQDWSHVVKGYWVPNWTRGAWYAGLEQKPVGAPDVALGYQMQDNVPQLVAREQPDSSQWIVIGWGGSISHVDSWLYSGIIPALDGLFERWPNLRLKFCGTEARLDHVLNRWGDRVIRQEGVRPEHWPLVISSFDIGVAPLDMRPLEPKYPSSPRASYDERRSWLKGVEYLCAGVPWVGSKSLTYAELSPHGTLCDPSADGWFNALNDKIADLAGAKAVAWQRRAWAMRRMTFEANVGNYNALFERMIAERAGPNGAHLPGIIYIQPPPQQTRQSPSVGGTGTVSSPQQTGTVSSQPQPAAATGV